MPPTPPAPAPYFAAAVLAVLAFFALRPGKGWLRRKQPGAALDGGEDGKLSTEHSGGDDHEPM